MIDDIEDDSGIPALDVDVLERGERPRAGRIACIIERDIQFSTRKLETYCLSNWQPMIFDVLLVAAAVEFCDHIRKRPALGWCRDISLRIPVHDPVRWSNPEALESLIDALNFVTGDRWDITFRARKKTEAAPLQRTLDIPSGVEAVIPFSNGLDSFAAAFLAAQKFDDRVLRVRLGPSGDRHRLNADREPFASIPYRVRHATVRSVETSARSRGFKFAMLSGLAAHLVQAKTIIVPESGQGALGPTLVPVGHAYEDYRNHPLFTQRMEKFLVLILGRSAEFKFPRLWFTKGETLKQFLASGGSADTLLGTRSCWQNRRQVSLNHEMRQCGICAACMLRRMSVHAAGLVDRPGTYIWEDLSKPTFESAIPSGFKTIGKKAHKEYAIAGALHLDHLAGLRHSKAHTEPLKWRSEQLGKALSLSASDATAKMQRLLRAHEIEWYAFLSTLGSKSFVLNWTAKPHAHAA